MLWKDWSISIYNSFKYILIKLQPQGDNHAQAAHNHVKANDCKVDLYSMEQRCYERIVIKYTRNAVKYSLIKLPSQADHNHGQADDNNAKADDRKVNLYSIEQRSMKGLKYI